MDRLVPRTLSRFVLWNGIRYACVCTRTPFLSVSLSLSPVDFILRPWARIQSDIMRIKREDNARTIPFIVHPSVNSKDNRALAACNPFGISYVLEKDYSLFYFNIIYGEFSISFTIYRFISLFIYTRAHILCNCPIEFSDTSIIIRDFLFLFF